MLRILFVYSYPGHIFKIWMSFFPGGYSNYSQSLLCFKTKYEIDLYNELSKLDCSSFIFKFGDCILLHLVHDSNFENYRFFELRKEGKIKDLEMSFPVQHYNNF
jgi:hypothetical protein